MTERKPTLCIVAGPNGSGKTTTTIQLLNNEWAADSLYINPDNIAQETFGDWNSPEAVLKAAEEATRLIQSSVCQPVAKFRTALTLKRVDEIVRCQPHRDGIHYLLVQSTSLLNL